MYKKNCLLSHHKTIMKKMNKIYSTSLGLIFCISASLYGRALPLKNKLSDPIQKGVVEYKGKWYKAGDTIYGYKNYIKLVVGDAKVPLFLGIPHDGEMKGTPEITLRPGRIGRDIYSKPHALLIAELFKKDTGLQPWIIINEIHRRRVEPNTYPSGVEKRYGADTEGRKTYDSYHELMLLARSTMATNLANTKGGFFIDMHGHGHTYANKHEEEYTSPVNGKKALSTYIQQSEIGYALSNETLEQPDNELDKMATYSSIYAIAKAHPEQPFSQLIRGPYSLGALLDDEGSVAVPGKLIPVLERDAVRFGRDKNGNPERRPYFSGGFLSRKYGTAAKPPYPHGVIGFADNISSVQIETPGLTVRRTEDVRARSAHQFKRAIIKYLNHWYGYDFPNSAYPYQYYK